MFSNFFKKLSFNNVEPVLFALFVLLTLLPLLVGKYYITLDGPSHLYNAKLVGDLLLSGKKDYISDLYRFNSILVPNCSGHLIIAFFNLFCPVFLSEKLLMLLYFILTPLFFRRSLLFFNPKNKLGIYLIFPLMHNNLFYFGFFNLCLGITAMFFVFNYYLRRGENIQPKHFFGLTLLLGVSYFSHIVVFLVTVILLFSFSFVFIELRIDANRYRLLSTRNFKRRIGWIFVGVVPWLILTSIYFKQSYSNGPMPFGFDTRLDWLMDFRPILAFTYGPPLIFYGRVFSILLGCLTLFAVVRMFKPMRMVLSDGVVNGFKTSASSAVFLLFSIVLLVVFLTTPNFMLVCDRLLILFYLFFFSWLTLTKFPKWLFVLSLVIILYVQINIVSEYVGHGLNSRDDVPQLEEMATHVPEGNLVLVLNYSGNWLYGHASGYIGATRRLAVLENYEAGLPWFPVIWNTKRFDTEPLINNLASNKDLACSYFVNRPDTLLFSIKETNGNLVPVDFVFQIGENLDQTNPCSAETFGRLERSYRLVRKNNFCKLYIRNGVQAQ